MRARFPQALTFCLEQGWLPPSASVDTLQALVERLSSSPQLVVVDIDLESIDSPRRYATLLRAMFDLVGLEDVLRLRVGGDAEVSISFQFKEQQIVWQFTQTSDFVSDDFWQHALAFVDAHASRPLCLLEDDDPYAFLVTQADSLD